MRLSDAALVGRVRRGDAAAFDALVQRHLRAAYAKALTEGATGSSAARICEDAFLMALGRLEECPRPEQFGAWLFDIVTELAHERRSPLRGTPSLPPPRETSQSHPDCPSL
jgi:RNA polymerase sigma-70 factor (ECF subfamily)